MQNLTTNPTLKKREKRTKIKMMSISGPSLPFKPHANTLCLCHDETREHGFPTTNSDANEPPKLSSLLRKKNIQKCCQHRTASLQPPLLEVELESTWHFTDYKIV